MPGPDDRGPQDSARTCSICGRTYAPTEVVPGETLRPQIVERIRLEKPDWDSEGLVCRNDLARFRLDYVQSLLESERGELSTLEQDVLRSIEKHELVTKDIDSEFEQKWSIGERMADRIATFGGSWSFLGTFALFLVLWIILNAVILISRPVDPYPFILLNLVLSCLAAIQAPIIMMSQNRQEAKDRLRSQHDYKVNLKAELEIRHLHEKLDHLLSHQWERLVEIQELQLELLTELSNNR